MAFSDTSDAQESDSRFDTREYADDGVQFRADDGAFGARAAYRFRHVCGELCLHAMSQARDLQTVVTALADQVGVVLDNILLGEQTRQRAGQLETLSVIESALSETNTEAEILDVFVLAVSVTTALKAWLVHIDVDDDGGTGVVCFGGLVRW